MRTSTLAPSALVGLVSTISVERSLIRAVRLQISSPLRPNRAFRSVLQAICNACSATRSSSAISTTGSIGIRDSPFWLGESDQTKLWKTNLDAQTQTATGTLSSTGYNSNFTERDGACSLPAREVTRLRVERIGGGRACSSAIGAGNRCDHRARMAAVRESPRLSVADRRGRSCLADRHRAASAEDRGRARRSVLAQRRGRCAGGGDESRNVVRVRLYRWRSGAFRGYE